MTLGKRISTLREKRGMTQKELAKASASTQAAVSRMESDDIKDPGYTTLWRIADILGTSIDYLVGRVNNLTTTEFTRNDPNADQIVEIYRYLNLEGRTTWISFGQFLQKKQEYTSFVPRNEAMNPRNPNDLDDDFPDTTLNR